MPRHLRTPPALAVPGALIVYGTVNLAAPLADGEQVVVPRHSTASAAAGSSPAAPSGPLHLSTATAEPIVRSMVPQSVK